MTFNDIGDLSMVSTAQLNSAQHSKALRTAHCTFHAASVLHTAH